MNLNCDTFIKQEFLNAEEKLFNSLPAMDLNIPIKNEPILDESFSSVLIKNEPISQEAIIGGSVTIKTEENSLETGGTGDSFIIYELETPPITEKLPNLSQQTGKEMLTPHPLPLTPQIQISNVTQTKQASFSTSTQNNIGNTKMNYANVPKVAAAPPILLNSQLRKRHKVILPVNPIDKRSRYNIEGTMSPPIERNSVTENSKHSIETANTRNSLNNASKKIINHLIKHKRNQKGQEDYGPPVIPRNLVNKDVKNTITPTRDDQSLRTVPSQRISSQTTSHAQTEQNLITTSSTTSSTPVPIDHNTRNSPKPSTAPLIVPELRVKCLCSLTDVNTKDNSELKSFFKEMFEETRRLNKTQQHKVKITLLKAICDAEELVEKGKCCDSL